MSLSLYHTATPGALEETFKYNAGIFIVYVFMSVLMSLSLYHTATAGALEETFKYNADIHRTEICVHNPATLFVSTTCIFIRNCFITRILG